MTARSRTKRPVSAGERRRDEARAVAAPPLGAGHAARARGMARLPAAAGPQVAPDPLDSALPSSWALVFVAWLVAAASALGALFFSEVMELPPCVLCWYQRIFMFPLVLLLPLGLFPFDRSVVRYALPLAVGGWLIAAFHLLLVAGLVPESVRPCTQGVPCSDVQIQWLGFVSIPLLSFVAFSAIGASLLAARLRISK